MTARVLEHDWYPRPVPDNVTIGERSWLYSTYAFLHFRSRRPSAVRIGSDTGVYNGSFFDLGPEGEVAIGDFCTVVGAIVATNGRVVIGDYAFVAHEVVIADDFAAVPPHEGAPAAGSSSQRAVVEIGENAWIGARAVLLAGARIGANSVVGAAAVVDFDVPADCVVAGNPARIVKRREPAA